MSEWIPDEEWTTIVENVPIASVDLLVECPDGIVLGRRTKAPTKGEWFVPGGRVLKGETLAEAVHRIATSELGTDVGVRQELGTFEHFYETSDVDCAKHYVAHGFHVWTTETGFEPDAQHAQIAVFEDISIDLHEYVEEYLDAAGLDGR